MHIHTYTLHLLWAKFSAHMQHPCRQILAASSRSMILSATPPLLTADDGCCVVKRLKQGASEALRREVRLLRLCAEKCTSIFRYIVSLERATEYVLALEVPCPRQKNEVLAETGSGSYEQALDRQASTMHVCEHVYEYVHEFVNVYLHVHVHIHVHACMLMCIHVYTYMCIHVCNHVCVYMCICQQVYIYIHMYTCMCTYRTCTYVY